MAKCPITKKEIKEYKRDLQIGDLVKIPVRCYLDDEDVENGMRMEYCIVRGIYPYVVDFDRVGGGRTSMTYPELCILKRAEDEARAKLRMEA